MTLTLLFTACASYADLVRFVELPDRDYQRKMSSIFFFVCMLASYFGQYIVVNRSYLVVA